MERSDIMSGKIITRIVSSLEKALADTRPENYPALEKQSALLGETLDFQLLVLDNDESIPSSRRLTLSVTGMPGEYSVREAVSVFCDFRPTATTPRAAHRITSTAKPGHTRTFFSRPTEISYVRFPEEQRRSGSPSPRKTRESTG